MTNQNPPTSAIPTVESLQSVAMEHRFTDLFNPPALTNFWGSAQAAEDITGIRSVGFAPLVQGEVNIAPLGSNGTTVTGVTFLDGEYFAAKNQQVRYHWRPDRVIRTVEYQGLSFESTMIIPFEQRAVMVKIRIRNAGNAPNTAELKLNLAGGVSKNVGIWDEAFAPGEIDNRRDVDSSRGAVIFKARHSEAFSIQGGSPVPDGVEPYWLIYNLSLEPGEEREITFIDVLSDSSEEGLETFDVLAGNFERHRRNVEKRWNEELAALYSAENSIFSGALPQLITRDDSIRRLYQMAAMTALYNRRTSPDSVYGTTYVSLMPRYWETTSFIWDMGVVSPVLAMLDPDVLRKRVEYWVWHDIHEHFGTEYLTGEIIGAAYSANDYAICQIAWNYVRWTGDYDWLDKEIHGKKLLDYLLEFATHWKELDTNGHGLADYGDVFNLLEAVHNYEHEIAALNAANVFNMRFVAELLEMRGRTSEAESLRREAGKLLQRVLELSVDGEGFWYCRQPDGELREIRHCYDFCTILTTIPGDLPTEKKSAMLRFFRKELKTPTWMRALSLGDNDVTFSIRSDHQWTGAFPAWPALAALGLFHLDEEELAVNWLREMAKVTGQGPLGQAHFAEDFVPPENGGGALKVPSDQPWINDWSVMTGMTPVQTIIEGLFGVSAGLDGALRASPGFGPFDPEAKLTSLRHQGSSYTVTANGPRKEE